jgi:hypothetical protein
MNAASTLGGRAAASHETLEAALQRAAGELARQAPPPAVAAAVQAAFARSSTSGTPPRPAALPRRAWAGLALCAVVLAASVALMLAPDAPMHDAASAGGASGFVPVAPVERWREAQQAGPAWIVATELPRERLAALGLPFDPARAGEPVRAELLLHPTSGDVLAVRLLR